MSFVGDVVGGIFGTNKAGKQAADASVAAAQIAAKSQRDALNYLKQQERLPTQIRDQALRQLSGEYMGYGQSGGQSNFFGSGSRLDPKFGRPVIGQGATTPVGQDYTFDTGELYERAADSPLFLGQLGQAEEAALRAASATGGLRGGGAISDVASVRNNLLAQSYQNELDMERMKYAQDQQRLAGIAGLAGLNVDTSGIANMMSGIGQTQAQGLIGAGQAQQAAAGQTAGLTSGLLGLGAALAFSDERLKDDIEHTGYENGCPTFKWTWNKLAEPVGLSGEAFGTLSKYAKLINPDAVKVRDGFETVDYELIGVTNG